MRSCISSKISLFSVKPHKIERVLAVLPVKIAAGRDEPIGCGDEPVEKKMKRKKKKHYTSSSSSLNSFAIWCNSEIR